MYNLASIIKDKPCNLPLEISIYHKL